MAKEVKKVAFLTAGGLAPCLSSSIGFLIDEYNRKAPNVEMIGYINGYMGLLKGESIPVTPEVRKNALVLTKHGGSPIGNSRVKLTNVKDCVKRGLVKEGEDPLKVAAENLEQAIERCGTKQGNKGFSAMQAAIETANVLRGL